MTITTPVVDPLGPEGAVASALSRNVEPFGTTVLGYDTVLLMWTAPALGSWQGIQVVRSRSGFPRTPDDGMVVFEYEHPGWNEENSFTLTGLSGGYHYFSLFLKDSFGWHRVSEQDALVPYDYSSTDRMWDTLPEYYRTVRDDTADISKVNIRLNPSIYSGISGGEEPNLLLSAFISLFGWGFDLLRTQAEYLTQGYDPTVIHTNRLRLLAQQFGYEPENSVPAHVNRTIVRNLASLYRSRGTLDGIHDTLAAVSGWEVEVSVGPNMLLSEDQSGHINPTVPKQWDPTVKYSAGDLVRNGDYTYVSVGTNLNAIPPTTASSNGSWTYVDYPRVLANAARPDTGDINTWQVRLDNGSNVAVPTAGLTKVAAGAPDVPVNNTSRHTNVLQVFRTGSNGAVWADVLSVPAISTPTKDARQHILEAGIPIPRPTKWDPTRLYLAGEFVVFKGAAYEAQNASVGIEPTSTVDWNRVGADDRVIFTLSTYAHGPFVGTAGSGGKTVIAKALSHGADGAVLQTFKWDTEESGLPKIFDPFVEDNVLITADRTAPTGQVWATDGVGNWTIQRDDNGGWVTPPSSGKSHRWIVGTLSAVNIAVTWTADPGTSRLQGIIFRRSDANNFWIATQTGLFKVVAGAARANPSTGAVSWSKFLPGERMRVLSNPATPVISVYRNGTLVGTTTDNFNSSALSHGLGTEA